MKFDIQNMLAQAQKLQQEMERVKGEIKSKTVEVESGGGMVYIKMNGANELLSIRIAKEIINPDDPEMLEDLIVAAVNKAVKATADLAADEMSKVGGMLPNIPGLNLNF
jgi:DNA-binding YbaB/EbfC family protein